MRSKRWPQNCSSVVLRQGENKQEKDAVLNQLKGLDDSDEIEKVTKPSSREELLSMRSTMQKTEDFDGNSDSTREGYEGEWTTIPKRKCVIQQSQRDNTNQTNSLRKPR